MPELFGKMSRTVPSPRVVLLGLCVAACATAPPEASADGAPTGPPRVYAPRLDGLEGLANVARLSPQFYRGAQPTAEGYRGLRDLGIRTVISFRHFFGSRDEAEAAGLDYVSIPIYAAVGSSAPSPRQVEQFFDVVLDPARQPVFIHCRHGADRTGIMAALYRIECQGWTKAEAIEEMQAFGYHDIYRDLIGFVRGYEPRGRALPSVSQRD